MKRLIDESDPEKHGINSSTWTCTELRIYFRKKGISVSEETIRRCLRKMGAHYVKAALEYAETFNDEVVKEREEFARAFIEDVKAKPVLAAALSLFLAGSVQSIALMMRCTAFLFSLVPLRRIDAATLLEP